MPQPRARLQASFPGKRFFPGLLLILLLVLPIVPAAWGSAAGADLSGSWKQSNERCVPKRTGEVSLRIEQRGEALSVETSASRGEGRTRHAVQRYTTDGKVSVSTGADGDEFHTSVVRDGESLIFNVEEHEDGRILLSKETWTLIEGGAALQRVREAAGAPGAEARKQTLIYLRQPAEQLRQPAEKQSTHAY